MAKVYAFLAQGLEEVECLSVVDVLRRGGVEVTLVSVDDTLTITGAHGITVTADRLFEEVDMEKADVMFLPGGMPGTKNLRAHAALCQALLRHGEADKRLAAICAAPSVLGELGLLKGKKATCYPGFEDKLVGAFHVHQGVVTDGHVTTARGLGYGLDLGIELLSLLLDRETAEKIRASIQYDK